MPSRLRRYDEPGHVHFVTVSCYRRLAFFRHDGARNAFIEALRFVRDKHHIRWLGYVVMPEHVHFLVLPEERDAEEPVSISLILHDLKGFSGRVAKRALRDVWKGARTLGTPPMDAWATGDGPKPFWKTRGYDFNVVQEAKVKEKLDYLHGNPVRRGLVHDPEEWCWSSYRYYELGDESVITMDWDGGLPI